MFDTEPLEETSTRLLKYYVMDNSGNLKSPKSQRMPLTNSGSVSYSRMV